MIGIHSNYVHIRELPVEMIQLADAEIENTRKKFMKTPLQIMLYTFSFRHASL